MTWLIAWVTAEPTEAAIVALSAVCGVIAVVCGVAAYRIWRGAAHEDWLGEGNVRP